MEFALSQPPGYNGPKGRGGVRRPPGEGAEPGWAHGLRRLYNSVLNEPLPDSFDDLLKKLDKGNDA